MWFFLFVSFCIECTVCCVTEVLSQRLSAVSVGAYRPSFIMSVYVCGGIHKVWGQIILPFLLVIRSTPFISALLYYLICKNSYVSYLIEEKGQSFYFLLLLLLFFNYRVFINSYSVLWTVGLCFLNCSTRQSLNPCKSEGWELNCSTFWVNRTSNGFPGSAFPQLSE